MSILTLGPAGTFSHEAAMNLFPEHDIVLCPNFDELVQRVRTSKKKGKARDQGFVPLENSLHGSVDEVLDLLLEGGVKVWKTYDVTIHHALGAQSAKKITKIASHPQALAQCRQFLRVQFPRAERFPVSSTSYAIELALHDPTVAAIALEKTMRDRKLPVISSDIQQNGNTTRFGIIAKKDPFPNAKRTQMSIVLHPTVDRPGLLHDLLTPFKVYDVNLTKIESRPTGQKLGDYVFFVDFLGKMNDARVQKVLSELKSIADVRILGEW